MAKEKIQAMREELAKYLIDNSLSHDTHFYTKEDWAGRGETVGNEAELSFTFEGAFYHLYNHATIPLAARQIWEFLEIVKKHGYYAEQGYAWSLHFYPQPVVVLSSCAAAKLETDQLVQKAREIAGARPDPWSQDKKYLRNEWKREVADDNTVLGYWDWVDHQKESNKDANVPS